MTSAVLLLGLIVPALVDDVNNLQRCLQTDPSIMQCLVGRTKEENSVSIPVATESVASVSVPTITSDPLAPTKSTTIAKHFTESSYMFALPIKPTTTYTPRPPTASKENSAPTVHVPTLRPISSREPTQTLAPTATPTMKPTVTNNTTATRTPISVSAETTTTSRTPRPTETTRVTSTLNPTTPQAYADATVRGKANLREGPGLQWGIVGNVDAGEKIRLIGYVFTFDGYKWYKADSGGWIWSGLVTDEPDNLPELDNNEI